MFQKLALLTSSGKTIHSSQLGPLGKANLSPQWLKLDIFEMSYIFNIKWQRKMSKNTCHFNDTPLSEIFRQLLKLQFR